MFAVTYRLRVLKVQEKNFIEGWEKLIELIYEHEGSFGSKLHHVKDQEYLSYATWPDKQTWANSGKNLPEKANEFRSQMRDSCSSINTEDELELLRDLSQESTYLI